MSDMPDPFAPADPVAPTLHPPECSVMRDPVAPQSLPPVYSRLSGTFNVDGEAVLSLPA